MGNRGGLIGEKGFLRIWFLVCLVALLTVLAKYVRADQREVIAEAVVAFVHEKTGTRPEVREVAFDDRLGLYVVKLMVPKGLQLVPLVAYVSKDLSSVTLGRWFDLKTGEDLTKAHMAGFVPERVKINTGPLREGPFLGSGPIELTFVGSPRCPHCREVFSKLVEMVIAKRDRFSLAYLGIPNPHMPETEKFIACLREKRPELFWEFLLFLYIENPTDPSIVEQWIRQKEIDPNICQQVQVPAKKFSFNVVPLLILQDGTPLEGSLEIKRFIEEHGR